MISGGLERFERECGCMLAHPARLRHTLASQPETLVLQYCEGGDEQGAAYTLL